MEAQTILQSIWKENEDTKAEAIDFAAIKKELSEQREEKPHRSLGKAFTEFVRDEVVERKGYASFLIWGKPGTGKTVSAVKLCMQLDPTFLDDFENRYIIGDQYDKLFDFLKKAAADPKHYFGKAYLWDEIGIGAMSEEHAKKEQVRIAKVYQMVRFTGTILVGTLTWARLLSNPVKSHMRYIIEIQSKDTANNINFGDIHEVIYRKKKIGGEIKNYLDEIWPEVPERYTIGTPFEGGSTAIDHIDFHLPRKSVLELLQKYELAWKIPYLQKMQQEEENERKKEDPNFYDEVTEKILEAPQNFIIKKSRTEHIDREKLKNIFGLNNRDLRAVFEKLRLKALDSGRLEFADRLRL